jgi:hypothetical protein
MGTSLEERRLMDSQKVISTSTAEYAEDAERKAQQERVFLLDLSELGGKKRPCCEFIKIDVSPARG